MRQRFRFIVLAVAFLATMVFVPAAPPAGRADVQTVAEHQPPNTGEREIDQLIERLKSSTASTRIEAAMKLAQLGPKAKRAVPALSDVILIDDINTQLAALHAMARLGSVESRAIPRVVKMLAQRPAARVRADAFAVLSSAGDKATPAVGVLADMVGDRRNATSSRLRAAQLLGKIGSASHPALPQLRKAAKDRRASIRAASLVAIGEIGPEKQDIELLTDALGDHGANVSAAAVTAFLASGHSPAKPLAELLASTKRTEKLLALAGLARIGKDASLALNELAKLAPVDDQGLRDGAALVFRNMGNAAVPAERKLANYLKAKDREAVLNTIRFLNIAGPKSEVTVRALASFLKDEDVNFRLITCLALGNAGEHTHHALPDLLAALDDDNSSIRITAVEAIGLVGIRAESTLPRLQKLMKDPNMGVRIKASVAIQKIQAAKKQTASVPTD